MKIAIHQPNFLPWLGYFYKMAQADIFVLLDTVQYEKNGYTNRVKIRTPQDAVWFTLPIQKNFPQIVRHVQLADFPKFKEKTLKTLSQNYSKSPYFNVLFPKLKNIFSQDWQNLANLNIELIKLLKRELSIKTKLALASKYNLSGKSDTLLINICRLFGANTYLSGSGGSKYQDKNKFKKAKIKLEYINFIHPTYPQSGQDFLVGLSSLDLLFNQGSQNSKQFFKKIS